MSDNSNSHSLPTALFSMVIPVAIVVALVYYFVSAGTPTSVSDDARKVVSERIQKVGQVELRSADREMRTGEQVFKAQCTACHTAGALGAPKLGDAAAWAPRIKSGYDALLNAALKGKNSMSAQGGGEFNDFEIGRAVVYMANASGGKFAEPAKPAADK
jgi:cytochrome c5